MARATYVKKARKDIPDTDIKAGDSYYWWKFMQGGRGGPKRYSKTAPTRGQLTQSEYLGTLYDIQDQVAGFAADSSLPDAVQNIIDALQELGDQQQEKLDNMPDSLQQGSTGELLQERIDACESSRSELEGLDMSEYDAEEHDEFEDEAAYWQSKIEEVQGISIGE